MLLPHSLVSLGDGGVDRSEDPVRGMDAQRVGEEGGGEQRVRAGVPSDVAGRMKALERENRELRQANEILRKASAYFAMAGERGDGIVHRHASRGVRGRADLPGPADRPSTYHAHVAGRVEPTRRSARARRDDALGPELRRVFEENFRAYGARKVWRQLRREKFDVARCTVARLMRAMGLAGVIRGKPARTTVSDKAAPCPLDRVNRQSRAPAPNMLRVSDFTPAFAAAGSCRNLGGVRLRRLRHRHLCPPDRRLARQQDGACQLRPGCARAGASRPPTGSWVDWFDHRRLLEPVGNVPPAGAEQQYYAAADIIDVAA